MTSPSQMNSLTELRREMDGRIAAGSTTRRSPWDTVER
jgi:hypothetical protein